MVEWWIILLALWAMLGPIAGFLAGIVATVEVLADEGLLDKNKLLRKPPRHGVDP